MIKRERIESLQNPRVKHVVRLRERRERDRCQRFIIEGYRELHRAVEGKCELLTLFICPEHFLKTNETALIKKIALEQVEVVEVAPHVFCKMSYRDRPDGLLAVAKQTHLFLDDLNEILSDNTDPFLLVAESIEKPGNLGTILRSCDAAGVSALILCDPCTDLFNPNVVRASVGTLFTLPVIEAQSQDTLTFLKDKGILTVATSPSASKTFTKTALKGPIAIAVGSEQIGLSSKWLEEAAIQVKIPMHGKADSLNVATATTLLLYEVVRQRA